MASKKYDVVAKTGTYTDKDGNEKQNWLRVGSVLENDKGPFLVLEPWFNPAGIDSNVLSLFEPKQKRGGDQTTASASNDLEDEIPF